MTVQASGFFSLSQRKDDEPTPRGAIGELPEIVPAEQWINTAWSLAEDETWTRETAALPAAGGPSRRLLVARKTAGRTAPAGVELLEAWRYLLEQPPSP
jgi:hypothetical protein